MAQHRNRGGAVNPTDREELHLGVAPCWLGVVAHCLPSHFILLRFAVRRIWLQGISNNVFYPVFSQRKELKRPPTARFIPPEYLTPNTRGYYRTKSEVKVKQKP